MSDLVCHGSRKLFRPVEAVVTTGTCVHRMTATTRRLLELADSLPFLYGALRMCSDEDLRSFATSCCSCSMVVSCVRHDGYSVLQLCIQCAPASPAKVVAFLRPHPALRPIT